MPARELAVNPGPLGWQQLAPLLPSLPSPHPLLGSKLVFVQIPLLILNGLFLEQTLGILGYCCSREWQLPDCSQMLMI